ncbi:acetylcholinesterase-like [Toxorhynchites rutilus septentrionalis]|uniref:acetylcholinesterase-like n=1 Tax=Toxorhynchites rutilus septentrionalis TaxID=329112 RepID=UPI00247960FF|nr:acetylcholinesterase-like [Toxorhynchites rutilus septentrionalis]
MWISIDYVSALLTLGIAYVEHAIWNVFVRFWPGFERPIIEVQQGRVQGVTAKLPNGSRYHFFKGIPYASSPVGNLRFRAPVRLERFYEPLLNCSTDKGDFIQKYILFDWPIIGSENELYLNVYTPALPKKDSNKYPVMVYVHGGGYRYGTASSLVYDPVYLIQREVVVVTFIYRLGPLGFLCLPNAGISGNAGLKDQRLVLQWVHENIGHFGGDADNVTLFGESAGSLSTYLHYLSPNSRKYFHRVICQSGDACTESAFQVDPEGKARKLARLLGCTGDSDEDVLDTLMKASARSLVKYQDDVISPDEEVCFQRFLFKPVIEQQSTEDSIITRAPEEIIKSMNTLIMPIMSGCTSGEGALSLTLNKYRLEDYNRHPEWLVPRFMGLTKNLEQKISIGQEMKTFYLGDNNISWETVDQTCDLMSDATLVVSNNLSAEWIAKFQPNVKHYNYYFSFSGRFDIFKKLYNIGSVNGVYHGDDIFYLFSPSLLPNLPADSNECKVRDFFVKVITNFAKFGDPTPDGSMLGFTWEAIQPVDRNSEHFNLKCLEITQSPRMVQNPHQDRMKFWRNLIRKHTNLL